MPLRSIRTAITPKSGALRHARWKRSIDKFSHAVCPVALHPKFPIDNGASYFCMGSCFARNIEEHLLYRGVRVLSRRLVNPASEWRARPNGIVNKFTTLSMLNEVRWLFDPPPLDEAFFAIDADSLYYDLHLAGGQIGVSYERAVRRRRYLMEDYFARLREADIVILTLGLNEVWRDSLSGFHMNDPQPALLRTLPSRFSVEIPSTADNVSALTELRALLKGRRSDQKYIVTVSPVPMNLSFSGDDVIVANCRSKSILRAAAEEFAQAHDDVDYFPSFEMVTFADRKLAYADDCRHVMDGTVRQIVEEFLGAYHTGLAAPQYPQFNEMAYLDANPDVEDLVRSADYESGYAHWLALGRDEARPLIAPDGPSKRVLHSGFRPDNE